MSSPIALAVSLSLFVGSLTPAGAAVCDGWGGGNCVDARMSRSSSSSSSSSSGEPPVFFDGHRTQHALEMVRECGSNALCGMFRAMVVIPLGLMFDAPVYAVKGVGYGLYYGAVGIGRGVAYPFKAGAAARAEKRRKAREVVACVDRPNGVESFDAYRAWERCKKDILKRQKALTKNDPSNKENELWCKGHIPLSSGPNTSGWLARCNPGGSTTFGPPPQETASTPAAPAPAEPPKPVVPESPKGAPSAPANPPNAASTGQVQSSISNLPATEAAPAPAAGDEALKGSGQDGFDSKGTLIGTPRPDASSIPTPNAPPVGAPERAPAVAPPSAVPTAPPSTPSEPAPVPTARPENAAAAVASASPSTTAQPASAPMTNNASGTAREETSAAIPASGSIHPSKGTSRGQVVARKAADCGLAPFLSKLDDVGFVADVRQELDRIFKELKVGPSGKADSREIYSLSRNTAVHSKDGERQAVLSVGIQRLEDSGEFRVDVQYALTKTGEKSFEGQSILRIARDGKITPVDLKSSVRRCIGSK